MGGESKTNRNGFSSAQKNNDYDKKYKERAVKYKNIIKIRDSQLKETRERLDQCSADLQSEQKRSLDLESRFQQFQVKVERELKRVKGECTNLLKKQELEFGIERQRLEQKVDEKEEVIREKNNKIQEIANNVNTQKQREVNLFREEFVAKTQEKNQEIG